MIKFIEKLNVIEAAKNCIEKATIKNDKVVDYLELNIKIKKVSSFYTVDVSFFKGITLMYSIVNKRPSIHAVAKSIYNLWQDNCITDDFFNLSIGERDNVEELFKVQLKRNDSVELLKKDLINNSNNVRYRYYY